MTTSVVFPASAAPAIGYLKSAQNDIEIFVEDTSAPNIWVKLLRNFLPEGVKLSGVNILGGRDNVLEACRLDQANDGRKKLYIIDADLDIIKQKRKPNLKHLYRLRNYCMENYIIQENALIMIATTFDSAIGEVDARRTLNLQHWIQKNSDFLRKLFVCYAAANELAPNIPSVSFSAYKLRDEAVGEFCFCRRKSNARIYSLLRSVRRTVSAAALRQLISTYSANSNAHSAMEIASGKDYLLPFIFENMKRMFRVNVDKTVFKALLASNSDRSVDPYLVRRLSKICA